MHDWNVAVICFCALALKSRGSVHEGIASFCSRCLLEWTLTSLICFANTWLLRGETQDWGYEGDSPGPYQVNCRKWPGGASPHHVAPTSVVGYEVFGAWGSGEQGDGVGYAREGVGFFVILILEQDEAITGRLAGAIRIQLLQSSPL